MGIKNFAFGTAFDSNTTLFMNGLSSKPPFERMKIGAPPMTETFAIPPCTLVELRYDNPVRLTAGVRAPRLTLCLCGLL